MDSIAVVVIDTLRYDYFNSHFGWLKGHHFSNAYSTSHWTIPAHASIFTGRYGSEAGAVAGSESLPQRYETLPASLNHSGYKTRMISANPQLTMWDGWDNGFDEVYGPSSITPGEEDLIDWEKFTANHDGIQRIPKAVVECIRSSEGTFKELIRGIRILRNSDFPTVEEIQERIADISFNANSEFLFVNMMDVHTPYAPPKEYRSQKTAISPNMEDALTGTMPEKEVMRQAYESSVQYVSDIYKDIHDLLTDSFDYVFTISDHGELLGEYNLCNHNYGVYPELTHVPLQISGRDIENQTSETPVSILDIHQTIAELANVDVESRGQNLLGEIHPQPRLTEYHGLTKWLKETLQEKDVLQDYLTTPVYGVISDDGSYSYQAPESISEDLPHLDRLKADLDVHQNRGDTEQISDEVRKQLEELGYA